MAVFKNIVQDNSGAAPMGNANVGFVGHVGYAGFSHKDRATTANYALLQASTGETYLNGGNNSAINFRISNNTRMRLTANGWLGIGTTSPGFPLDVVGAIQCTSDVRTGGGLFNTSQATLFWPESNLGWTARSGNTGQARIVLKNSANVRHGSIMGTGGAIGMLDASDRWAMLHENGSYTRFYDNGELMFHIGQGFAPGNFGSVQTYGNGAGGWEGYNINGWFAFMAPNQNEFGIYNDTNNEWMLRGIANNRMELFYDNISVFQTTSDGIRVQSAIPRIYLTDTNSNPDWSLQNANGIFRIINDTAGAVVLQFDGNNNAAFGVTGTITSKVDIESTAMRQLRLRTQGGPSSAADTNGQIGDIAYDADHLYIKTSNGWGRVALDFVF